MLVWFCIRAKLRAHTLRHPCLARSSRCIDPLYFYNLLKSTSIASPRTTTLASLVKGEVLSPEKIRATTGGIAFLPYPFRFSDTSVNNPSIVGSASHCNRSSLYTRELKVIVLYQPSQNRTIPRPAPPPLPPLSKVRCCRPKEFGRLPEGLSQLHPTFPSSQPLQKDNSTSLRTTFLPYERSACFASHCLVSH